MNSVSTRAPELSWIIAFGRGVVSAVLLGVGLAQVASADVAPDEVAVLAMAASPQSREVAEYYVAARGIPQSQILLLGGRPGESVSRDEWEQKMRPAIADWLVRRELAGKIRCMVTCWDVPLKIGKRDPDCETLVARRNHLALARQNCVVEYGQAVDAVESLGTGGRPGSAPARSPDTPLEQLAKDFDEAAGKLRHRMEGGLSAQEKKQTLAAYERLLTAAGGSSAVLTLAAKLGDRDQSPPQATARLELEKGRVQGLQQGLTALSSLPDSVARDVQILALVRQSRGILGAIRWIDQEQQSLEKNETDAGFDSELSLLAWPDYPSVRWMPNTSHYAFDNRLGKWPTLMVSRLAAPTVELVKKLIDASIATEKTGLSGKFYLDARGIRVGTGPLTDGSYTQYDQSLRDLAKRLAEHTDLEVVLNDEGALFQPGDCPDAALYCGWYSLGRYVDAFDWRSGAVGYHLASSEAAHLRTPGNPVWCNAMLEDGICATLGPVTEPYLISFPLPDDFFSLLLTGRYTLVEAFYRTKRFNSWQMVLVGDPLYNPFKSHPRLSEDDLPERMKPEKP